MTTQTPASIAAAALKSQVHPSNLTVSLQPSASKRGADLWTVHCPGFIGQGDTLDAAIADLHQIARAA